MFSKAKLKRFNEEIGCAPPPTAYNPKLKDSVPSASLDKSQRWKNNKEETPGPGAYATEGVSPIKRSSTSSSRLNASNLSTCSNSSNASGSNKVFLSPPRPRAQSHSSLRGNHGQIKSDRVAQLQEQIEELVEERKAMRKLIAELETQLNTLKSKIDRQETRDAAIMVNDDDLFQLDQKGEECQAEMERSAVRNKRPNTVSTSNSTQTNDWEKPYELSESKFEDDFMLLKEQLETTTTALVETQQLVSSLNDERSGLQLKLKYLEESAEQKSLSEDELHGLREHIDHLTLLRDNLETSVLIKDDLIAELQVQLDEMVIEGRGYQQHMEMYKCRMEQLQEEIESSFRERSEAEGKVRGLVAQYEALMKDQVEERDRHLEILARKDIEIELLSGSLNELNIKITEYEKTLSTLQDEASQHRNKISLLESTVCDFNTSAKEKEVMESMLEEELNRRTEEVCKLEESIQEIQILLHGVEEERGSLSTCLQTEKKRSEELSERVHQLEMQMKEKEVVQQFLEKEITSREAEVSESSAKVKELECDLETARQVALDLQQEAEVQLNKVLTLKASISAKDFDIDAKGELIATLQEEISHKVNETTMLHEKFEFQSSATSKMEELLNDKEEQIATLNKELSSLKTNLSSCEKDLASLNNKTSHLEESNHHLEEKVVELMAEISDREAEHIIKVNRIESELDDLGVKYSEALLDHEATRRVLTQTSEQLEKENLLRMASEADIQSLKEEVAKYTEENKIMESNLKDLVQKYTNLEDALACEEAENRDLEDRLEREVRLAQEAAATAQKDLTSLQTSNSGFCIQITQLKIDMRKKSQAVEEMQQCIEALREEKLHLTTLRDNLEKTVESKEDAINKLHLEASTLEREMEEERVTLRSRIGDLENHLKESEDKVANDERVVNDLKREISFLKEENLKVCQSFDKQLEDKTHLLTQLEDMERKYEGYEDQLNNLQTSLLNKTAEAEDLHKKYKASSQALGLLKEEMGTAEVSIINLKTEKQSLNNTLVTQDTKMKCLYKSLEEKKAALVDCEKRLCECEESEKQLMKEKDEAAVNISNLQDALNATKSQLSRLEITFSEEKTAEVSRVTCTLEADIQDLRNANAALQEELYSWKNKFQHLEEMIEPFREQLDAYEIEKANLLERSSAAKEEVDKLSKQYATLLGHQNHKQKIQHVLKLKTENVQLKEEVHKLRQETERHRKNARRLEDKMARLAGSNSRLNETSKLLSDKENSFNVTGATAPPPPPLSSTPLKSINKPQRF
nr:hyaluronan mediated motility receptor-like [Procambarus clarkii]